MLGKTNYKSTTKQIKYDTAIYNMTIQVSVNSEVLKAMQRTL